MTTDIIQSMDLEIAEAAADPEVQQWGEPLPLPGAVLPDFPVEAFAGCPWVRQMVEAVAEAVQTPVDLPAVAALAALSTAARGHWQIQLSPGWVQPLSLYLLSLSPPSTGKSAVVGHMVTRPIGAWLDSMRGAKSDEIRERNAARQIAERRRKCLLGKVGREDDAARRAELQKELESLEEKLEELRRPVIPRIFVDDVTPQRLAELLGDHGSLAAVSAEANLLEVALGLRYGAASNTGLLCSAWTGERYTFDRIRSGSGSAGETVRAAVELVRPTMTIALFVQEAPLRAAAKARGDALRGQGLLARILPSIPRDMVGQRDVRLRRYVRRDYIEHYSEGLRMILEASKGDPVTLTLSEEATEAWLDFAEGIERSLRAGGSLAHFRDWGGRARDQAARLAGLLHLAEALHQGREFAEPISTETMNRAVALIRGYFMPHALEALDIMGLCSSDDESKQLLDWLKKRAESLPSTIEKRFVAQFGPMSFRGRQGADRAASSLETLAGHGWLQAIPQAFADRDKPRRYQVHPRVREGL